LPLKSPKKECKKSFFLSFLVKIRMLKGVVFNIKYQETDFADYFIIL